MKVLVVGGNGFVGNSLSKYLGERNYDVHIMDMNVGNNPSPNQHYGDIAAKESIDAIFQPLHPKIVICLAAYGMSGSQMLDEHRCNRINVDGVSNLLESCKQFDVDLFVYTSTYNVVYGGNPIINGDETLPYYPEDLHSDYYAKTKSIAEKMVISADRTITKNGQFLKTGVIRPAAIYGEGEMRHFPRVVSLLDLGLFQFRIGRAIVDWVHVENLSQAYEKLISKLILDSNNNEGKNHHVYFISDDSPIENFEFFRPLCKARQCEYPPFVFSKVVMLGLGYLCEKMYQYLSIPPFLTRTEVLKVGETHYMSMKKARIELNYEPTITTIEGSRRMAHYYSHNKDNRFYYRFPNIFWWISIFYGMTSLAIIAYKDQSTTFHNPLLWANEWLSLKIFRSYENLQFLFVSAVAAHAFEASYALRLCWNLKCSYTWPLWGFQTLCLGFPSLRYLLARQEWNDREVEYYSIQFNENVWNSLMNLVKANVNISDRFKLKEEIHVTLAYLGNDDSSKKLAAVENWCKNSIGKVISVKLNKICYSDRIIAVSVELGDCKCFNEFPHITIALNGAEAVESNHLLECGIYDSVQIEDMVIEGEIVANKFHK